MSYNFYVLGKWSDLDETWQTDGRIKENVTT